MFALQMLKGKKTYIVGILMLVLGFINGDNQMMLEALGIMTLRNSIPAATPPVVTQ